MARISVKTLEARSCVTVSGRLLAADLRRLERACGPALERRQVALELRLTHVSTMDSAARAFIHRLAERGALIIESSTVRTRSPRQTGASHRTRDRLREFS